MELTRRPVSTVRLRKLAADLKAMREQLGLSLEFVANRIGRARTTLYRIEEGKSRPQRPTLDALLDVYGASAEKRTELHTLAKESAEQGWLRAYGGDLPEVYATYIGLELEALQVENYESLFVPGLLQTREYAHAVIGGTLPTAKEGDIRARVEVRMRRQAALRAEEPLQLAAVIDEAAIRRVVGSPAVMVDQLRSLAKASDAPNVTLRVIPYAAGAHPGMAGSFALMRFRDPSVPPLVYIDSMAAELILEKSDDLRRYTTVFEELSAVALSAEDSARLITEAARRIKK